MGNGLWQRRYAANVSAVGSGVVLDGKRYTIVGIAAAGFRLGGEEADVYTPMGQDTARFMQSRGPHPVTVIARLRSGATQAQAEAELAVIGRRLAAQYPDTNKGRIFVAQPLRPEVGNVRSTLWLLLGAVGLVLLIACVNVASLLFRREAGGREAPLGSRYG